MKITGFGLLSLVALVAAGCASPGEVARTSTAPLVLTDMDGGTVDVNALAEAGEVTALVFWQSW